MQSIAFHIRKATDRDLPSILRLLEQANMHHIGTPEMPKLTYDTYLVAESPEGIVGFCGYKILSDTEAKTELMVVDSKYRGYGIGLMLQTKRMELLVARGVRTLTTNTDLPPTIAWYKKHFGYQETGTLRKINEFGDPTTDHWTTLQVDLVEWDRKRREAGEP
ncbi:GNAT family N-acetyltransferase [candidate division GN15 bacterium]|nr:GNAT family N-acetyltransferase [candidate division GN15 bacterium]